MKMLFPKQAKSSAAAPRLSSILYFLIILALLLPATAKASAWQLAWSDEFNGSSINTSVWGYEIGKIRNNEEQYYTSRPENAHIENGNLILTCLREDYAGSKYTSASLNTYGNFSFQYGRLEMRAKLPSGKGIWPAFWTLGANAYSVGWPNCGEIDVMEMIGGGTGFDNVIYGTIHWYDGSGKAYTGANTLTSGIYADDYHTYAVEWTATSIKWYMDNINYATVDITNVASLHLPQYILVNLAIGGGWPDGVGKTPDDTTILPQNYYIDYIRVYEAIPEPGTTFLLIGGATMLLFAFAFLKKPCYSN